MTKPRLPGQISAVIAISLVWAALFTFDLVPQLRGDFGWRWPYAVPDWWRVWPMGISLGVYVLGAGWLSRRARAGGLLGWAMLGSVALTLAGLYVAYNPFYQLYSITVGPSAGGWHYAAAHITNLRQTLATWPAYMTEAAQSISSHLGISPPGAVVAYYAANRFLEQFPGLADALGRPLRAWQCHQFRLLDYTNAEFASAWLGILTPLWASVIVWPLYWVGRRLYSEPVARWAVIWWPLVPSFLLFAPSVYTLYPLSALLIIGLLASGLRHNRPALIAASGLIASGMLFVTFAFAPLLLIAGLLALGFYWQQRPRLDWGWPVRMGMWFGLGLSLVWVAVYGLTGLTPWAILREASQAQLELERPYWPWLILHLNDFFMFTGWPLALLAGIGVWRAARQIRAQTAPTSGVLISLSGFITLLLLIISGTLRGEAGRILLFLSPFLLFIAAEVLPGAGGRAGWAITVTQALVALVMVMFLQVLGAEFSTPPPAAPPIVSAPPAAGYASGAIFANALQLDSFAGQVVSAGQAQPAVKLWLDWRSTGQVDVPYYLSLIPVAPDGQVGVATVVQPFDGQYPTTCWSPASGAIRIYTEAKLPPTVSSGDWWISVALIDARTGAKANVLRPDGAPDDQVGIGPFPQK